MRKYDVIIVGSAIGGLCSPSILALSVRKVIICEPLSAAKGLLPGCKTPIQNLFTCGASTFPGIGIPAVSASGAYAAEKIIGKNAFKSLLKKIEI